MLYLDALFITIAVSNDRRFCQDPSCAAANWPNTSLTRKENTVSKYDKRRKQRTVLVSNQSCYLQQILCLKFIYITTVLGLPLTNGHTVKVGSDLLPTFPPMLFVLDNTIPFTLSSWRQYYQCQRTSLRMGILPIFLIVNIIAKSSV